MSEGEHPSEGQYPDAMATGSDAGAPGDHLPDPPLSDDEKALLADLQQPGSGAGVAAIEDSAEMISAVEDDGPLPAAETVRKDADPDDPRFEPPAG